MARKSESSLSLPDMSPTVKRSARRPVGRPGPDVVGAGLRADGVAGPPQSNGNLREQILDAAESVFADRGFAGTALREVAALSNVTQGLVGYYFESKLGLFEQVFLRRSQVVSRHRVEGLAALQAGAEPATARQIVEAFLAPALSLRSSPGGRSFIRLQARLHLEPPEISYRLRDEAYTESTRMYVTALVAAIPGLCEKDAYWRMTSLIGTYIYVFSDTHRLEEYAPGLCNLNDSAEVMDQVSRFVVGGLTAP
jgi:AcrR family transcriptional regulator